MSAPEEDPQIHADGRRLTEENRDDAKTATPAMSLKEALRLTRPLSRKFCRKRIVERLRDPADPDVLRDLLELVCTEVSLDLIANWTPLQCAIAEEYAAQAHLSASDNAYIRIPPRPEFLPAEKSYNPLPQT